MNSKRRVKRAARLTITCFIATGAYAAPNVATAPKPTAIVTRAWTEGPVKMTSEAAAQEQVILGAASDGHALWRNNSGACTDDRGRQVRYGLGNTSKKFNEVWKSPDLVGPTHMTIQPHHVGRTVAIFTGVEMKRPGWVYRATEREVAQANCLGDVIKYGGIGMFCTSLEGYRHEVQSFIAR